MCLLALVFRVADDAPVVVGANREEFYARGGDPPRLHSGPLFWAGGVDPRAGGTWLGVNASGLLVAVTNRRKTRPPQRPRSRGLLVRELLETYRSAAEAVRAAEATLALDEHDGCNIVCVDARDAVVIHAGDSLETIALPAGVHVLANRDVNGPDDHRVTHVRHRLQEEVGPDTSRCLDALRRACADCGPEGAPVCFRGPERGTVSSSLLALRPALGDGQYLHAQGPPDRVPYADCSHLLRELVAGP
jgi:uncharacterized protein with NRDE domain